jgi:aminoglycoside 2'-N-acetyltransferase I
VGLEIIGNQLIDGCGVESLENLGDEPSHNFLVRIGAHLTEYLRMSDDLAIQRLESGDLSAFQVERVRELLWAAFEHDEYGGFTEDDWQHALGGVHFIAQVGDELVAHAAVVERDIHVGAAPLRTGYVEAVATAPSLQRRGYGSAVMRDVNALIRDRYELGVLGTGSQGFYERLGWQIWRGPSYVRTATGELPTPDEDGYLLVFRTPSSPAVDLTAPISCEWREGDVW